MFTLRRAEAGTAAVAAAALIAACSSGARIAEAPATTTTAAVVGSTTTTASTVPAPPALDVGQELETNDGNVVRVHSYLQPVPAGPVSANAGSELGAADVEVCAGRRGIPRVSPDAFRIELPDGTMRNRAYFGAKEPRLADAKVAPGTCVRGWVTFEAPEDERPAHVVFQGSSVGRWRLGDRRR